MGRGTLLVIAAGVLAAASVALIGQRSLFEMDQKQNRYGHQVVAREVALSGLERGLSAIKLDLMDVPRSFGDRPVSGGTYDIAISDHAYGNLDITSRGTVGDMRHEIRSNVIFEYPADAALVIGGSSISVDSSGTYMISGVDNRMPSVATGPGFLQSARGIQTDSPLNRSIIASAISAESVYGDGGQGSIADGVDLNRYEALYAQAISQTGKVMPTAPYYGSYGSASDPAVVHITGDFQPAGAFTGTGVLVVDNGNFIVSDGFRWEGLVLIRKSVPVELDVVMDGSAAVYGSVAAYEPPSYASSSSCSDVPFTIDGIETRPQIPFQLRVDILGAAISAGGAYDMPVTSRIHMDDQNADPWGSYTEALTGNVNRDGTYNYEPGDPLAAGTGVTISGTSWTRTSGDGTQNADWAPHMEQDSEAGGSQLMVLRDGDAVPNIQGYLDQGSVASFVNNFIDPLSGTITLDENQSIYLFELGTTNTGSAAYDMQDLVALVTMIRSDEGCTFSGAAGNNINVRMAGASQIRYSGEALAKAGSKLGLIEQESIVVVTSQRDVLLTPEEAAAKSQSY